MILLILLLLKSNKIFSQDTSNGLPPNSNKIIPSLNFKNTDMRDVLRSIAFDYKTNVVISNDITVKISIALFDVSVLNAIKMIAEDYGFAFSYDSQRFAVRDKKIITSPPPPKPEPIISYNKGKLSVRLNNVNIRDFVNSLREKTNFNFLISSGTTGKVTGELTDVGLKTGLKDLLLNNGYYLTTKDSIYYITRSDYFSSLDSSKQHPYGNYWVSGRNDTVTLDVVDASINRIIEDLSNQMGFQVVILTPPTAKVTVKCSNVPLNTAFSYLFKGTVFSFKKDNGAYIIGKSSSKDLENTKLVRLNYLRADELAKKLPSSITKSVNVDVSIEHNALVLSGDNDDVSNAIEYIKTVDQPVPQVLIEALVVDYNLNDIYQFGITVGRGDSAATSAPDSWYPGVNVTASGKRINKLLHDIGSLKLFGHDINIAELGKLPSDFYVNLSALEQDGIANVKSRPILSTLNGHTASLKIGTVQNYVFTDIMPITSAASTSYIQKQEIKKIEANISFEITPWVGANDELTLEIKPDFQTPVGTFSPDKNLIPAINTRSLNSTVRLKNGETIVLGGLIQQSVTNTKNKFPILGDIPIIGQLFTNVDKKTSRSELLIYLTPKISYDDDYGSTYYNYAN